MCLSQSFATATTKLPNALLWTELITGLGTAHAKNGNCTEEKEEEKWTSFGGLENKRNRKYKKALHIAD